LSVAGCLASVVAVARGVTGQVLVTQGCVLVELDGGAVPTVFEMVVPGFWPD
jgi:hypothetical protein